MIDWVWASIICSASERASSSARLAPQMISYDAGIGQTLCLDHIASSVSDLMSKLHAPQGGGLVAASGMSHLERH